ncbi:MAG: hypothetical protein JXO49_05740 [Deltaproteobacteria bacterium]|nr:hypothetical protein [Candidatus Anaeroferrophillus wilburensis]MBN2888828.1 hypothetical protein [Deltaproteobacteria bacterium]
MKKSMIALLVCVFIAASAAASFAAMGEVSASKNVDMQLFGSNRLIPSYFKNLVDYNSDTSDAVTLTEGGWGAGFFVRNELRLGFKGTGENWGFKVILEDDIHMTKDNVDRNDYGNADDPFGSEFSVERSNFWYNFGSVKFSAGWDVKFLDLKTGGLVYGDDHPFIELSGGDKTLNWALTMLLIEDSDDLGDDDYDSDWYAYNAKLNYVFATGDDGKFTLSPFVSLSHQGKVAMGGGGSSNAYYYGLEGYGNIGIIQPQFEIVGVTGDIDNAADYDISSYALHAGVGFAVSPEFNPYLGFYYVQGDDDPLDDDLEGFVGITNIARYTPMFGMDGAILYEHLGFGAPLYGNVPERSGLGAGDTYGGIGGAGKGSNPGLVYYGIGSKGKINSFSYKVQLAYLEYAEEDALGLDDDEIGYTFDFQVKYPFSPNFYVTYVFSCLDPGDGLEEYIGGDDTAIASTLEIGWTW